MRSYRWTAAVVAVCLVATLGACGDDAPAKRGREGTSVSPAPSMSVEPLPSGATVEEPTASTARLDNLQAPLDAMRAQWQQWLGVDAKLNVGVALAASPDEVRALCGASDFNIKARKGARCVTQPEVKAANPAAYDATIVFAEGPHKRFVTEQIGSEGERLAYLQVLTTLGLWYADQVRAQLASTGKVPAETFGGRLDTVEWIYNYCFAGLSLRVASGGDPALKPADHEWVPLVEASNETRPVTQYANLADVNRSAGRLRDGWNAAGWEACLPKGD